MLEQLKQIWSGLDFKMRILLIFGVLLLISPVFFFGPFSYGPYYSPYSSGYGDQAYSGEEASQATYVWEGTIDVENRYNGTQGRHKWTGEYKVKFLEVPSTSQRPGRIIGQDFRINDFIPQELIYTIHADHNWDKDAWGPKQTASGAIEYHDVTYSGVAQGRVTAADGLNVNDLRYLLGDLNRLDSPHSGSSDNHHDFASYEEYASYLENAAAPLEQGWFNMSIGFIGWARTDESEAQGRKRQRDMYKGIDRGGREPMFFEDPNADFIHWIPAFSPDGINVVGRLDSPDQREVSGSYSFPFGGPDDSQMISMKWFFTRTPIARDTSGGGGTEPAAGGTTGVASADVALAVKTQSEAGKKGEKLPYSFEVTNLGEAVASQVNFAVVPGGAEGVSIRSTKGECQLAEGVMYCALGNLQKSETVRIDLTLLFRDAGNPSFDVSSAGQNPDPDYTNNTTRLTVTVK